MAKKFGLGDGADALFKQMDENEDFEDSISVNVANVISGTESQTKEGGEQKESTAQTEAKPAATLNLPQNVETDSNGQLWIKTELLKPNPYQPRVEFDEEKLRELADSIKEHGILQSITVEAVGDGTFYIITGERRTRAAKIAGLDKVPVQLRKFNDQKKLEIAIIENVQRTDLNPVEEAKGYLRLMDVANLSQEQVAVRVGKNRTTIANAIRLLKLPEDMLNALSQNKISAGHARALLSVKDPHDMRILFTRIIENELSVRQAENYAAELNYGVGKKKKAAEPKPQRDPDFVDIEQKFIEKLGTKVLLKGDFSKGTIEIEYYNREDLDRIYDLLSN